MKLQPLRDRVVIEPLNKDRTASGLYIPETAREKQTALGRVRQVGPGTRSGGTHLAQGAGDIVPMDTKVGDLVIYPRYAGVDVEIDGKPFVMVRDHEILATYTE